MALINVSHLKARTHQVARDVYPNRPVLLTQHETRQCLQIDEDGSARFTPLYAPKFSFDEARVPPDHLYDIVVPTMYGLLEDLTPGSPSMDAFLAEWSKVEQILVDPEKPEHRAYGQWAYYPRRNDLVRFAPARWHRLALVVRNATLLAPQGTSHDWEAGRARLDKAVIAVAGCSVGSAILHRAVMLLRPRGVKIADAKDYQLNNGNRVRLGYADLSRNKANVCAEQLHEADPFLGVWVYGQGIDEESAEVFVQGEAGEPAADLVVEETDDPDVKLLLRERARAAGVPVLMVTDAGSAAQVDVRRFDVDPHLSLALGVSDEELYELRAACDREPGDRDRWLDFALAISGRDCLDLLPTFREVLFRDVPAPFSGFPQLASAAGIAGGAAAWAIAQVLLGYQVWERVLIEPGVGVVRTSGEEM